MACQPEVGLRKGSNELWTQMWRMSAGGEQEPHMSCSFWDPRQNVLGIVLVTLSVLVDTLIFDKAEKYQDL